MKENGFTYRFTAAAIMVFMFASFYYSGIFSDKLGMIEKVLTHNTDIRVIKDKFSDKRLACPAEGVVTNEFSEGHTGVDIASENNNEPIVAAAGGTVIFSGEAEGYGNCVKIDHGNGTVTLYGHMAELCVNSGDAVKKTDKIGIMGSTGDSTGRHLHYEVIKNGIYLDPKSITAGL